MLDNSDNDVETLARELLSAYQTGDIVPVPLSERPGFDLNTAYAIEATLKQFREAEGHRVVGRKVGYANKAMWRALKLETLVWAHMYDDTVHFSDDNAATLVIPHPRSLKVEPEIVFGLKQTVMGEGLDAAAALASADWLAIGFEIIDCPFPAWKFQPSDFVASFGLHAGLVIGERVQIGQDHDPEARRRVGKVQGAGIKERRVCRRRIRQEFFEESSTLPGGTQRSHRTTIPQRAAGRGRNCQLGNAHGRASDRQRRSLES